MKRFVILLFAVIFVVIDGTARGGFARLRPYRYNIMVAAARSAQGINTYNRVYTYATTDSARCSTPSAKYIVEENKVEPEYTVTIIIAIVALAIVCIGSLLVASYVSDRKLQKSSHFTYSVCKASPELVTRRRIVVLANGGGILIL